MLLGEVTICGSVVFIVALVLYMKSVGILIQKFCKHLVRLNRFIHVCVNMSFYK